MAFKVPNQFRITHDKHPVIGSDDSIGLCGAFDIPWAKVEYARLFVIATDGANIALGWEHVSVHGVSGTARGNFTPSWEQMCFVKDLFWDEEDTVIQYHPPKSQYVNHHQHTLHLWRNTKNKIEVPPRILIG